jgi:hypothetical protein
MQRSAVFARILATIALPFAPVSAESSLPGGAWTPAMTPKARHSPGDTAGTKRRG